MNTTDIIFGLENVTQVQNVSSDSGVSMAKAASVYTVYKVRFASCENCISKSQSALDASEAPCCICVILLKVIS